MAKAGEPNICTMSIRKRFWEAGKEEKEKNAKEKQ